MSNDRYELCFVGSGGQGVILASIIYAEAALLSGKKTVQSQAYGPEARGGSCRAEAILSDNDIRFTKILHPDFLLALTQQSLDQYASQVRPGGMILGDSSLTPPKNADVHYVSLPILRTANEEVKKPMTANIVATGAVNELLHIFSDDVLEEAVRRHIPAGTEEVNMQALKAGKQLGVMAVA